MKLPGKANPRGAAGWIFSFFLVLLVILAVFFLRPPRPCQEPLTYRIGTVDARFGVSRRAFADSVGTAAALWEKPLSRQLFREDSNGMIEISLIYDHRQEAVDTLKKLSYKIENTQSASADLKFRLEKLKTEYEQKKSSLDRDLNAYNARVGAFNAEIQSGGQPSGVAEPAYRRLMMEKDALSMIRGHLQVRQEELKNTLNTMNSMVVVINEIATHYNLDLVHYRHAGNQLGDEYYRGTYTVHDGKHAIAIYQYDDSSTLVRVLAHELGHALGLNHIDAPGAVMYRLIQSDSRELSPEDIAALNMRCGRQ
jgi:hypothetical protein